jgi:NAD(P)-dependent dehydrogenase (short-subunit alcohol dehydrogenase family)
MKTAMIWGAAGGIGQALVKRLIADDWTVLAVARQSGDLENLTPLVFEADVARAHEVEQTVLAASYEVEQVDLWIYAAGDITSEKVETLGPETWQRILDANLTGAFLTAHYSLPLLAQDAHLFFLGAISERMQMPGLSVYAAAKAGLESFAEAFRKEARKRRVTIVRPSAVDTPLWQKVPFRMPANAMVPETVADGILEAYAQGHKGQLDIT